MTKREINIIYVQFHLNVSIQVSRYSSLRYAVFHSVFDSI